MTDDAYGRVARFYDTALGRLNEPLNRMTTELAPAGPGDRVLDVGCGTGSHLAGYVALGATCTGIDSSPAMLAVAADRLRGGARLDEGDASALPYPDGSFDVVFSSLVLHEMDPDTRRAVLDEMVRVTDAGGRIAIIDYYAGALRWKGRVWRAFSTVTERVAGSDHYTQWRTYLDHGGIPNLLPATVTIERTKIVAGGNLAIWIVRVAGSG